MRIAFIIFISVFVAYGNSAEIDWGNPVDGNWDTPGNWDPGSVPGAGDDASIGFDPTGSSFTVTVDSNTTVQSLTLQGARPFVIAGGATSLEVTNGLILSEEPSSSHDISVELTTPLTINAQASGLGISGDITGAGALTKTGSGTVVLSGTNNYTGDTNFNAGTLEITLANQIGSGDLIMNGGGLSLTVNNDIEFTQDVTMTGDATFETVLSSTMEFSGTISAGSSNTINIQGQGVISFTGQNNFDGITRLSAVLNVNETGLSAAGGTYVIVEGGYFQNLEALTITNPISLASSSSTGGFIATNYPLEVSSVISGPAGSNILFSCANDLTISGENTALFSDAFIQSGTLIVASANNFPKGEITIRNDGVLNATTSYALSNEFTFLVDSAIDVDADTTLTLNGEISGVGPFTKKGSGTLIFNETYLVNTLIVELGTLHVSAPNSNLGELALTFTGGDLIVSNYNVSGSQSVTVTNDTNWTINSGASLTFSGDMSGAGAITKLGTGTLILSGTNSAYSGATTISAGTVQVGGSGKLGTGTVILNGGTLSATATATDSNALQVNAASSISVASGATYTLSGGVTGGTTDALTKSGTGTLVMSGDWTTGDGDPAITVSAGTLQMNGDATNSGTTTVGSSGTLKGTGTLNDVVNNGTVIPGASIGTLNIVGDYTQDPSANLEMEVDRNGSGDRLNVTGTATLRGKLAIIPSPGPYREGAQYILIEAGTRSEQFGTVIDRFESEDLGFSLTYNSTQVILIVDQPGFIRPILTRDLKGNAKRVSSYLYGNGFIGTGDLLNVQTEFSFMSISLHQIGLVKLSPVIFGALPRVTLLNDVRVADMVTDHFKQNCTFKTVKKRSKGFYYKNWGQKEKVKEHIPKPPKSMSIWAEPIFAYQNQQSYQGRFTDEGQPAFTAYTYGSLIGWGDILSEHSRINIGTGLTHSNIFWSDGLGQGKWNTFYLAPSYGWLSDDYFINTTLVASFNFYRMERGIHVGTIDRKVKHNHTGYDLLTQVEGGARYKFSDMNLSVQPEVQLNYFNAIEGSYTEGGASSLNLKTHKKYVSYLQPTVLMRFIQEYYFKKVCFAPSVYIGWLADISITNGKYRSRFVNEQTNYRNFYVQTYYKTTNQMLVGCELPIQTREAFSAALSYESQFFSRYQVQQFAVKLNVNF